MKVTNDSALDPCVGSRISGYLTLFVIDLSVSISFPEIFVVKITQMNKGKTVFAQLMEFLPWYEFDKCVARYNGNYKVQTFDCRQQFLVMSFAQLTNRSSLHDIENCLDAVSNKLYHSGIKRRIPHSTLADANEQRDWRIYADFAQELIPEARRLNLQDSGFTLDLKNMVYALDSTTIDLCLSLFPWARFRTAKGAVKAHVLMDLRGSIPSFIKLTDGLCHDVNVLDNLPLESGAFYLMDRGYVDFERLYRFVTEGAFFVTRAKSNLSFRRIKSAAVDKKTGLRCDQTIALSGVNTCKDYPAPLRRVKFWDDESKRSFVFLTNAFSISALMVAMLYKERWQVELFFRWIKQHLRIKSFYGTSRNAVYAQIWIAVCVYLLLAIIKPKLQINQSLHTISKVLEFCIFEKMPVNELFNDIELNENNSEFSNQLSLWD